MNLDGPSPTSPNGEQSIVIRHVGQVPSRVSDDNGVPQRLQFSPALAIPSAGKTRVGSSEFDLSVVTIGWRAIDAA